MNRTVFSTFVTVAVVLGLSACQATTGLDGRPFSPQSQLLVRTQGAVNTYDLAPPPGGFAKVCATAAGYCPLPQSVTYGLRCSCDVADGAISYPGRTGDVPSDAGWTNR